MYAYVYKLPKIILDCDITGGNKIIEVPALKTLTTNPIPLDISTTDKNIHVEVLVPKGFEEHIFPYKGQRNIAVKSV